MKKTKIVIFSLFFSLLTGKSFSQQAQFNITVDEKIHHYGISYAIAQDQQGYIWFSSFSKGLVRYNGKEFKNFKHEPENPNSLVSNEIISMAVDSSGMIWLATYGSGLDRFDPTTNKFTHFRYKAGDSSSIIYDTLTAVMVDHSGNVYVSSLKGIDIYDSKSGKFSHIKAEQFRNIPDKGSFIFEMMVDKEGIIWFGIGDPFTGNTTDKGGLYRYDPSNRKITLYKSNPKDPNSLINPNVTALFEDSKGNFWVGTKDNGLHTFDRKTGRFTRHLYDPSQPEKLSRPPLGENSENDFISFINEDNTGKVWIGSLMGGINSYDPVTQKVAHFGSVDYKKLKPLFAKDTLSGFKEIGAVRALRAKDGLLWISGFYNNIYTMSYGRKTIPYFSNKEAVNSFYLEPNGNTLWFGTDKGLARKDLRTQQIKTWSHDPKNSNSLNSNSVVDIKPDEQGMLWLATHLGGMDHFDPQTGNVTRYKQDSAKPESIGINGLHCIFIENEQYLWVGGEVGLSRLDRKSGKFNTYKFDKNDSASFMDAAVFSIIKDKNNNIWIATSSGVNKFNRDKGNFKRYLKDYSVKSVYEDSKGKLWAGSSEGLFYLDAEKDKFKSFTTPNFPNGIEQILNILEDNEQNLWITTANAIIKLNATRDNVKLYNADYGILSSNWNWLNNYKAADGRLFIGGSNGYYMVTPKELNESRIPPMLNFSGLKIGDKEIYPTEKGILTVPFWKAEKIELPYSQNTFTIDFNAVDFHSSGAIKYLYQLDGFEKNWHDVGNEHKATYFGIPPGSYTLHIRAINSEGSMAEKSMLIVITPPWWRTWWAYIMYALLFLLAGWGIYKFQKQQIIEKERKRTQYKELAQAKEIEKAYTELKATQAQLIQSEKMASLGELTAGIAHEIQNPLNFVNNFSEVSNELVDEMTSALNQGDIEDAKSIATDIKQNLEKINHHGKRADAIVKGMLQHSRTNTGQKEPTDINALADEYLRLAFHGLRAKDKSFNAILKTDFDQKIGKIDIIPQDIGRVLLNLISNAFYAVDEKKKLTPEGYNPEVSVSTQLVPASENSPIRNPQSVIISVKDNGNGIPQKVLDKIFQPFFTTKPTGQGTGLGLSMSYDTIKAHGGELKVETKEGEGASFIIQLPVKFTA